MSDEGDLWDSFFVDAGAAEPVLRNLAGLTDARALQHFEYAATAQRDYEIRSGAVAIAGQFDLAHVRAVHRHLFQDVYAWAGELRPVNISKEGKSFVPLEQIEGWLNAARDVVTQNPPAQLDRAELVRLGAAYYALYNTAHPFREGNGRTGKALLHQLTESTDWAYDFNRVEKDLWDRASQESRPADPRLSGPDPSALVPVFDRITVERTGVDAEPETEQLRALHRTSYPRPPADVVREPDAQIEQREPSRPSRMYGRDYGRGD